jgi:adenosylhomocysteine nucleosidase
MKVLVTFAVDAEFAPWRKRREFRLRQEGHLNVNYLNLGGLALQVVLTGIGGRSGAWIETTFDRDIDVCISSGLAGALRAEHKAGHILVPKYVTDTSGRKVACDPELRRIAAEMGAHEVGCFYSTDSVIISAVKKRALGANADAVEMETTEVLAEAANAGARVIAIRGISDSVNEDLPLDFNRVTTGNGEVSIGRVFGQVARNPLKVPSLIRFAHQSRMAAERLCEFLDRYVEGLSKSLPSVTKEAAR